MRLRNITLTIVILMLIIALVMVFRTSENLLSARTITISLFILLSIYLTYNVFFLKNSVIATFNNAKEKVEIQKPTNDNLTNNYTYCIWFYVDDWNYRYGEEKVILMQQNMENKSNPLISLAPMKNNIHIITESHSDNKSNDISVSQFNTCNITNFPIQKWVCLIVTLNNRTLDVYLDGKLVRTCLMPGVPIINTSDKIILSPNGGFSGFTSNIQYMNNSINPQEAYNIYRLGYGGSILGNLLSNYKLKMSLYENNVEKSSIMI